MSVAVIQGDARRLPLPDGSVDLVVTSPPYFSLRSYQDGGEHYSGQIGSEATPGEWVDALIECTREWVRVLKPSGSLWVNLGDKYAGSRMDGSSGWESAPLDHDKRKLKLGSLAASQGVLRTSTGIPQKSLLGLPWRYALRCIDDLGLILRAEVVWSKPNGLPESVTDRVRRSHEQWFHFTVRPRYFSAVDHIREPQFDVNRPNGWKGKDGHSPRGDTSRSSTSGLNHREITTEQRFWNPLGKLPGSVWVVPSQPLTVPPELGVDHFAAFPMEWPRRLILGWSPRGVCTGCGEGRRPVVDKQPEYHRGNGASGFKRDGIEPFGRQNGTGMSGKQEYRDRVTITGEVCACPDTTAPTRPGVVLDPFGGTGTTALVADVLGRHGISVDLSHDYSRLARWRTQDPGQRAAAMQVEKPEPVIDGQLDLFAL